VAAFGIAMSVVWCLIQERGLTHLKRHETLITTLSRSPN